MKRRAFIAGLGGVVALPRAAQAQQPGRMRRIGVLLNITADDPEAQTRLAAFAQGLQSLGWTVGQNVRVDYRWGGGSVDAMHKFADQLVALAPDVILAQSTAAVAPLLQSSRTVPIVFTVVADPVGAGFVQSLAHPSGNATGFTGFEYAFAGKWLELLKELAPAVTRVAVLRDAWSVTGPGQFGAIQAVASTLGVELRPVDTRDLNDIERDIAAFARNSNGGMIVTGSPAATVHRKEIVALAVDVAGRAAELVDEIRPVGNQAAIGCEVSGPVDRWQSVTSIPTIGEYRQFAIAGGLASYGVSFKVSYRQLGEYVGWILKGEKPINLPVQQATKAELTINLKPLSEQAGEPDAFDEKLSKAEASKRIDALKQKVEAARQR